MKTKYELLCALQVIEFEISLLADYSRECDECYELLRQKLDELCGFIKSEENDGRWKEWGSLHEIKELSEKLRETSVSALCDMEKYQSLSAGQRSLGRYLSSLSESVREEYRQYHIHSDSKVLFIGSGAFPTSALTMAQETGASVICLDFDQEAITLSKEVARLTGLESQLSFLHGEIHQYPDLNGITHVFIASLVKNKLEVIEELKEKVEEGAKVVVRYGNGLKSVFNYPLEETCLNGWSQSLQEGDAIYDTLLLVRTNEWTEERA
ncbi:nicotianamine synthase family protein [Bacillus sp. KH172YL63]|uniref:nicotianamine synthase family protein n=1 Tax=Bacillus sp. KH172YL63 TaxID=2709784 RepID=UPI0013E4CB8A|nr:nicotianamine synthase family protein [Bacillus sp. KH172YL63]BCB05279.1 hypothetical protein KH172YL63_34120 [Bacillus sp. KH172YL63]